MGYLGSCCRSNNAWKPRFRCNDQGQTYDDAARCGELCGQPCDLLKDSPPDLKINILLGLTTLDICNAQEKELAFKRSMFPNGGSCRYMGKRCTERWKLGFTNICVQEKETYCCFDSPLAKIIIEAAHEQLNIPWGSAGSPNCAGLKPEEFQKLNLDNVDFSTWIDNYVTPAVGVQMQNAMEGLKK
jgi:hypothetical protein